MEEYIHGISIKNNIISEEYAKLKEVSYVNYDELKSGNIQDIYNVTFPEENFIDFYVNDSEVKLKILKLNTYRFSPEKEGKAVVIMFHGLNSHINHGAYTAKLLANEGFIVVGYDHRGFGKSEGLRGYIDNVDLLYIDALFFVSLITKLYPKLPIYLLGMSLGALISYKISLEFPNDIKGVILISPALKPIQKDFFVGMGIFIGWMLSKPQTVKSKIEFAVKNNYCKEMLQKDPLTYNEGTRLGTLKALLLAMKDCDETFNKFTVPFTIFIGGKDKIIDITASFDLIKKSKSTDKHLWYYKNLYHDIWNEEEIFDIAPKIVNWLNERYNK